MKQPHPNPSAKGISRWIVFEAVANSASPNPESTLYVVPASGGPWTRITDSKEWDRRLHCSRRTSGILAVGRWPSDYAGVSRELPLCADIRAKRQGLRRAGANDRTDQRAHQWARVTAGRARQRVPGNILHSRSGITFAPTGMSGTDASVKVMLLSSTAWMKPMIGARGMRPKGGWAVERTYDDVTYLADCPVPQRSSLRAGGRLGRALRGS